MGKSRISNYDKRLDRDGFVLYEGSSATTRRIFASIRENELRVFARDEAEGISKMIEDEATRVNKRINPALKVIKRVQVPRQKHEIGHAREDVDEEDEDEHGSSSVFFDASYLEVERVIGKRKLESDPRKTEYLVKSVAH